MVKDTKSTKKNKKSKKSKYIFTREDYNSDNGMMTYIWGPSSWHSLHTMSFNYPVKPTKKHKKDYRGRDCWFWSWRLNYRGNTWY